MRKSILIYLFATLLLLSTYVYADSAPATSEEILNQSYTLLEEGKIHDALSTVDKAIQIDGKNDKVYFCKATIL